MGRPAGAGDRRRGWGSDDDVEDDPPRAVDQFHVVLAGVPGAGQRHYVTNGRSPMGQELLGGEAALAYDRHQRPPGDRPRPGWLGTVTRRRVSGLYQMSWLPYAWRSKTKPALRRTRITSLAVREGAWVMGRR